MQKKFFDFSEVKSMDVEQLRDFCKKENINPSGSRSVLVSEILKHMVSKEKEVISDGFLEVVNGYGFFRDIKNNFLHSNYDIYVSARTIKEFDLRIGDYAQFVICAPKNDEQKFLSTVEILSVNNEQSIKTNQENSERAKRNVEGKNKLLERYNFEDFTPIYPKEHIKLERENNDHFNVINRFIDILVPIGRGQRALIIAPPKTGKTTVLQAIANGIMDNHPDIKLIILLIGERPEEVTEMKRVAKSAEILSSTFDQPHEGHIKTTEITLERAKRLVEMGHDVVVLMDSITRLVRAYNTVLPSSGKILTGGLEPMAIIPPKKFFGSARNIEGKGSLTIIASALTETGSNMDKAIVEEFKGTGNCEVSLDRKLSEKRIFPAVDIGSTGTRRYEEMLSDELCNKTKIIERFLSEMDPTEATKFLINKIKVSRNNNDLFKYMQKP